MGQDPWVGEARDEREGSVLGEALLAAGLAAERDRGTYALLGAAAVLTGMTRMTLTIAAILVEAAKDAHSIPALMIAVAGARLVGDRISHIVMIDAIRKPNE